MKLTWLGHSCFKIEKDGYVLIVDPYVDNSVPGLKPIREQANMVFCSHLHGDHHGIDAVEIIGFQISNPFQIELIETYHDDTFGTKRGLNKILLIDDGENKVAHLGDLGCEPEPAQMELLKNLDVLLIPVGGHYTIDAQQAADMVKKLKPRIVIPMHYRDDERKIGFDEIGSVSEFVERMDSVMTIPVSEMESTYVLLAQVVVMKPLNSVCS